MKRTCLALTSLFLTVFFTVFFAPVFVGPARGQGRSDTEQERIVRETYRKLETYNVAAQIFQNEFKRKSLRDEANLKFELTDFHVGNVQEILNKPYVELVTLPSGDIISLTRGGHAEDGGPQEATFGAAWEHGQQPSAAHRRRYGHRRGDDLDEGLRRTDCRGGCAGRTRP